MTQFCHLGKRDALSLLEIIHDSLECVSGAQAQRLMGRLRELISCQAAISAISKNGRCRPGRLEELD